MIFLKAAEMLLVDEKVLGLRRYRTVGDTCSSPISDENRSVV